MSPPLWPGTRPSGRRISEGTDRRRHGRAQERPWTAIAADGEQREARRGGPGRDRVCRHQAVGHAGRCAAGRGESDPDRDTWLKLSEEALTKAWDNEADDVFNELLKK